MKSLLTYVIYRLGNTDWEYKFEYNCISMELQDSITSCIFCEFFEAKQIETVMKVSIGTTFKLHIFWEGHKILQNLHLLSFCQSKSRWRFRKSLWPSQNIWTLIATLLWFEDFPTALYRQIHQRNYKENLSPAKKHYLYSTYFLFFFHEIVEI